MNSILINDSQTLLNNARDLGKLIKIRTRLSQPKGGIFEGVIPEKKWADKILGETFNKVILASKGIESLSSLSDITVLGGWCAIRTKCMKTLSLGKLTNPQTGIEKKYSNISEVCNWIKTTISLDQIVESVGIYNGKNYALISEECLWAEKIINTVELHLKRMLTDKEKSMIKNSLITAEMRRYKITKKYIEFIQKEKINITLIKDHDILNDLQIERNKLLKKVGTTVRKLTEPILKRTKLESKDIGKLKKTSILQNISNHIERYSLVWFMYTGPYLNILKKYNYIKTNKAIIIEPWLHIYDNEAQAVFNYQVFGKNFGENNHLKRGSLNKDIAIIGIDEPSEFNWERTNSNKSISTIPNVVNYKHFFKKNLVQNSLKELELRNNQAFIMGINYYPYNKTKKLLMKMINISQSFKEIKKNLKSTNSSFQTEIKKVKREKAKEMLKTSEAVIKQLEKLSSTLFQD